MTTLQKELVKEAERWVGITETSSIDVFRKAVDGNANGEAWCAGFVQYCCVRVRDRTGADITLPVSELCTYIWDNTPKEYRLVDPEPGAIIVWKRHGSDKGHIGIIDKIVPGELGDKAMLETIEGNTTSSGRATKGVFRKIRSARGNTEMSVLGFLKPFK